MKNPGLNLFLSIKEPIKKYYTKLNDEIFLYFHKDYEPIHSKEGKRRIRQAIDKYFDVPIIRLAYELIYFDSDFLFQTLSRYKYSEEEINMALGLINYCKETIKVR